MCVFTVGQGIKAELKTEISWQYICWGMCGAWETVCQFGCTRCWMSDMRELKKLTLDINLNDTTLARLAFMVQLIGIHRLITADFSKVWYN